MSKRVKDASEREDTTRSSGFLLTLKPQDLKKVRIYIGPRSRSGYSSNPNLERTIDDPTKLSIHYRPGEGQRPLFSRDDIVVNVEYDVETKKMVRKTSPEDSNRQRSVHTRSCDTCSSRSYSRSPSRSSRKDLIKLKEYHSRSESKEDTSKDRDVKPDFLRDIKKDVPSNFHRYSSRRYSPVAGSSRYLESEDNRRDRYRSSPSRFVGSPRRYEKNKSRSSSPRRSKYATEKYSRGRPPSPDTQSSRYSRSPSHAKKNGSSYQRKHISPPHSHSRKRSPSVRWKRTPPRESRRHSPHSRDHLNYGGYGRSVHYYKKLSPSPHRRSRSPHKVTKSRKSRSPYRRDKYERPRSRSYSSSDRRRRSSSLSRTNHQQEVVPPDFGYYGPEGYWIPSPFGRAFLPRSVFPPMGMPRNIMRPGHPPYIARPYLPMAPMPMHAFRPRHPPSSYRYNQPNKIKVVESHAAASTVTTLASSTALIEEVQADVEEAPKDTETIEAEVEQEEQN